MLEFCESGDTETHGKSLGLNGEEITLFKSQNNAFRRTGDD
jgi:hypothetical protein